MNKKFIYSICLFTLISATTFSQTFQFLGDKCFGGSTYETGTYMLSKDNYIYLCGHSFSDSSGNKTELLCSPSSTGTFNSDIWILKVDTSFNIIWQVSMGASKREEFPTITFSYDSTLIYMGCKSNSDSSCQKTENNRSFQNQDYDYWVGAIDLNGNFLWEKTIGGTAREESPKVCGLPNGDLMIVGSSNSPIGGDKSVSNYGLYDMWIVKTDSDGNIIWDKVYGGSNIEAFLSARNGAIALDDGSLVFSCQTNSFQDGNMTEPSLGDFDAWIVKIDSGGNILWQKRYGGDIYDYASDIIKTSDGGFMALCRTSSNPGIYVTDPSLGAHDFWLLKLDSLGNKLWDKRYGGDLNDEPYDIEQDHDGGYYLSGSTRSNVGFDVSEPRYSLNDLWVIKIDSVGNKKWDKRLGGVGTSQSSSGGDLEILSDGSIVLFGSADSTISPVKTDPGHGSWEYWLVRIQYQETTVNVQEVLNGDLNLTIHPNPSAFETMISIKHGKLGQINIFDVTGRLIYKDYTDETNMTISVDQWKPGLYFIEVVNNKGIVTEKLVVLGK